MVRETLGDLQGKRLLTGIILENSEPKIREIKDDRQTDRPV